eukprot:TRINITY_DN5795_c0_g1_i2.p1 TRINITY_DN5795_c0_g1~~TRINITY_DN5795_c0_g1_i2.p1  ORF type:complete len:164 (-),score=21.58 TRINITY_DN5795_c0_g1_i2:45-536(-)
METEIEQEEHGEVFDWLKSLHLGSYWENFKDEGFDQLSSVSQLEESELSTLLKIKKTGHRRRLWPEIQKLKGGSSQLTMSLSSSLQPLSIDPNSILGQGQFSKVFKGSLGNGEVAIKEINISGISQTELNSVKSEIELLQTLPHHENVIQYLGMLQTSNSLQK